MGNQETWLSGIIRKRKESRRRLKRPVVEAVVKRPEPVAPEPPMERDRFSVVDYGSFVHVCFGKHYMIKNPDLLELRDPITSRFKRVELPKSKRKRTTGYYRSDGSLIDNSVE